MAKRALALIIGNGGYPGVNSLRNPVNDANDVASKLTSLGFEVKKLVDATYEELEIQVDWFGEELEKFDIGLFYFAGHGLQIDGVNFITAIDTKFKNPISVKHSSISLDKIVSLMDLASNETNILILDACRDNPFVRTWKRSKDDKGLAPTFAPKGTLIAYATSPGQYALDGNKRNGLYIEALLKHIDDPKIPIEELFKRVRNTLFTLSNGEQISWEHTSLTGDFYFNYESFQPLRGFNYPQTAIADYKFENNIESKIGKIIEKLKSYDWYSQNDAVKDVKKLDISNSSKSEIFVLGRNVLQASSGGSFEAQQFIDDIVINGKRYLDGNDNHLINGIWFELFFDSKGNLRTENKKDVNVDSIFSLQTNPFYESSIEFINTCLHKYRDKVFAFPSKIPQSVPIDILVDPVDSDSYWEKNESFINEFIVTSIQFQGKEILRRKYKGNYIQSYNYLAYPQFEEKLSQMLIVPKKQLVISINESLGVTPTMLLPIGCFLSKEDIIPNNETLKSTVDF